MILGQRNRVADRGVKPEGPYRLVVRTGHLNVYISPKALVRFREEVRRFTRRTAGKSLRAVVSRLDRYLRGWGEYFERAEVAGLFDRYDRWITRRLRAFMAKRWRNGLGRRYPDTVVLVSPRADPAVSPASELHP